MLRLSPDFGIVAVAPAPDVADTQLVLVCCGCIGVWSAKELVGFSTMCYAHECFKLLARVWHSLN